MKIEYSTNEIMLISGMRGFGKSTFLKNIAKKIERYIVWDTLHEHGELGYVTDNLNDLNTENLNKFKKIIFQNENTEMSFFEEFVRKVWELNNFVLVVEEVDLYASNHYIPEYLGKLIKLGRHKGIGIIGVTRRIAELSKIFVAQARVIVSFRQWLPQDINYLRQFILIENEELIRVLEKHQYIAYFDGNYFFGKNFLN